jgi:hypothetical protein
VLLLILFNLLAAAIVLTVTYRNGKDPNFVMAAVFVVGPVLLGITLAGVTLHLQTIPGHSTARTLVDGGYLVILITLTTLVSWFFGNREYEFIGQGSSPVGSSNIAETVSPVVSPSTEPVSSDTSTSDKSVTTFDLTVVSVMLAIVAVVSLFGLLPLYQKPVKNLAFIESQATAIAKRAETVARGSIPTAKEVARARHYVNYHSKKNPSVVRGLSTGNSKYTVTNSQDSSSACLTFSTTAYQVSSGRCTAS